MRKPKVLYHGSPKKINGFLMPHGAEDMGKKKENMVCGIYATSIKNHAIAMSILGGGNISSRLDFSKRKKAIVFEGWPKQTYGYLYVLSSEGFVRKPEDSYQFVSTNPVKPLKVIKIKVKDYLHLLRRANKKEYALFLKKICGKK